MVNDTITHISFIGSFQKREITLNKAGEYVFYTSKMSFSTVAGCLWLTSVYLVCDLNPLNQELTPDITTINTAHIEITDSDLDFISDILGYNLDTWPALQDVYTTNGTYICTDGICRSDAPFVGIKVSTTIPNTNTPTSATINWLPTDHPTNKLPITDILSTPILSTPISSTTTPIPGTIPTIRPIPTLTNLKPGIINVSIPEHQPPDTSKVGLELERFNDFEEIALSASTGIFSFTTLIAIIKCLIRKKRYRRIFNFLCRLCNSTYTPLPQEERIEDLTEIYSGGIEEQVMPNESTAPKQVINELNELSKSSYEPTHITTTADVHQTLTGTINTGTTHATDQTMNTDIGIDIQEPGAAILNITPSPPPTRDVLRQPLSSPPPLNLRPSTKSTNPLAFFRRNVFSSIDLTSDHSSIFGEDSSTTSSSGLLTPLIGLLTNTDRLKQLLGKKPKPPLRKRLEFNESFYDTPV